MGVGNIAFPPHSSRLVCIQYGSTEKNTCLESWWYQDLCIGTLAGIASHTVVVVCFGPCFLHQLLFWLLKPNTCLYTAVKSQKGSNQQTQNICITFIQRRPNVFDVGPTLYKCYANVLYLLGNCFPEVSSYAFRLCETEQHSCNLLAMVMEWVTRGLLSSVLLHTPPLSRADVVIYSAGTKHSPCRFNAGAAFSRHWVVPARRSCHLPRGSHVSESHVVRSSHISLSSPRD